MYITFFIDKISKIYSAATANVEIASAGQCATPLGDRKLRALSRREALEPVRYQGRIGGRTRLSHFFSAEAWDRSYRCNRQGYAVERHPSSLGPVGCRRLTFCLFIPSRPAVKQLRSYKEGGEASPVGRPDFKSGKEPLAGPWWVRLPLSSATTPSIADHRVSNQPSNNPMFAADK
jgi:hypothetical protein